MVNPYFGETRVLTPNSVKTSSSDHYMNSFYHVLVTSVGWLLLYFNNYCVGFIFKILGPHRLSINFFGAKCVIKKMGNN